MLTKKRITLYVPHEVHTEGQKMATSLNMTLSGFVSWLVRSTVEANKELQPVKPFGEMTLKEFEKNISSLPAKAKKVEKEMAKKMKTKLGVKKK